MIFSDLRQHQDHSLALGQSRPSAKTPRVGVERTPAPTQLQPTAALLPVCGFSGSGHPVYFWLPSPSVLWRFIHDVPCAGALFLFIVNPMLRCVDRLHLLAPRCCEANCRHHSSSSVDISERL